MLRKFLSALLISAIALTAIPQNIYAATTVTASARDFELDNAESFSIADASQTGLDPSGNQDFYVRAEVKAESEPSAASIIAKYDFNSDQRSFRLELSGDRFLFRVSSDGTSGNLTTVTADNFGAISTGTKYIVEGYHDAANDVIGVCVNGVCNTTGHATGVADKAVPFFVGSNSNAQPWDGLIQSAAFYNAIPAAGVRTSLYNSGAGKLYHQLTASEKTGLVSWYDLAETSGRAIDAHGTNHLTDNNTVLSAAGLVTYSAEDASSFDEATSEWLGITDAAQTGLSPGDIAGNYYVAGWINMAELDSSGTNFILAKGSNSSGNGNELTVRYNGSSDLLNVGMYDNVQDGTDDHYIFCGVTPPTNFEFGTWIFFEVRFDYSGKTGYISINRGTENSDSWTGTGPQAGTYAFVLGSDSNQSASGQFMDGKLANFVFIHGTPTTGERDALFNRGFGVHHTDRPVLSTATYVSWWPLTEASGTRNDVIGTNHLTDNNTVTGGTGIVYDVSSAPAARRRIL